MKRPTQTNNQDIHGHNLTPKEHVVDSTAAKVRIFLSEIAEGVSNYRSLHNLTQQVEHQYHGRFLLELIQNAHDALHEVRLDETQARIEIFFDPKDSEFGTLFVANDGAPFSPSNFYGLAQLGQSDKDPQKSIGNKGLGFRSVLEICDCPEVYSRADQNSPSFDGYCFGFSPAVVNGIAEPIVRLAFSENIPVWSVTASPIVDWSIDLLSKFRRRVRAKGEDWMRGEVTFLSPYLLPVPLLTPIGDRLANYEKCGFATVIRLPLKEKDKHQLVCTLMDGLSQSTMLFLDRASSLTLGRGDGEAQVMERKSLGLRDEAGRELLVISSSNGKKDAFSLWTKKTQVGSCPESFRAAVRALPGRWPEITEIAVTVAVKLGERPHPGQFSIYLPTTLRTGSATHVNAPFYSNMSRTVIDFSDTYNQYLLELTADLLIDVVQHGLAGQGEPEAGAIVDLLAPFSDDPLARERWGTLVDAAAARAGISIGEPPFFMAEDGWQPLTLTSLLPKLNGPSVVTTEVLREHATFDIFHACLVSRAVQLEALSARYFETGIYPTKAALAETLESIAATISRSEGNWNGFWQDVIQLFPGNAEPLKSYKLLLGDDEELHASTEDSTMFFMPRQGTQDESEVDGEGMVRAIPDTLRKYCAFLSTNVRCYEERQPSTQTSVRKFLASGLVSQFRLDAIFRDVLIRRLPKLPVSLKSTQSRICRDILQWGTNLIQSAQKRGKAGEATLQLLATLPVPCIGGWFPMREASFGAGWPQTSGDLLSTYLDTLQSAAAEKARARLLVPPSHPAWNGDGAQLTQLLKAGGVFNGLKLESIDSHLVKGGIHLNLAECRLSATTPFGFGEPFWKAYSVNILGKTRAPFSGIQEYKFNEIRVFPGFEVAYELPVEARSMLSKLILVSLAAWPSAIEKASLSKIYGNANRIPIESPVGYFLRTYEWIAIDERSATTWAKPHDRWYVPAGMLSSRVRHFAHLHALPLPLARNLDQVPELASRLNSLGLPRFDVENQTTAPSLLNALANSVGSELVADENVLLGQIRGAWRCFRPEVSQPPITQLVVRRSSKHLEVINPSEADPVYLPDVATYVTELERFDLPVLAIETNDAKSLKEWFAVAYGPKIQLSSKLRLMPLVDGVEWTSVNSMPLVESAIAWLLRPLLSIVAFFGNQARGVLSQAFRERLEVLHTLKVDWVSSLTIALVKDEEKIGEMMAAAHWHKETSTIIISEQARVNPGELAAVLVEVIGRDDLEYPLQSVLSSLNAVDIPPESVSTFLAPLKLTDEHIQQVAAYLQGDIGNVVEQMHVFALLRCPTGNYAQLEAAISEEDILLALQLQGMTDDDIQFGLSCARENPDMYDFGRKVFREYGEVATLPHWNQLLGEIAQRTVQNRGWKQQLEIQVKALSSIAMKLIAHLLPYTSADKSFQSLVNEYQAIGGDGKLEQLCWEVDFGEVMHLLAELVSEWVQDESLTTALRASQTIVELRVALINEGVDVEFDPIETGRKNYQRVQEAADRIEKIRLAWSFVQLHLEQATVSRIETAQFIDALLPMLKREGFTRPFGDNEIYRLVVETTLISTFKVFSKAAMSAPSFEELEVSLAVTRDAILGVDQKLADVRRQEAQLKNIVQICGGQFDTTDGNLDTLWTHIESMLPLEVISSKLPLDISSTAMLQDVTKRVKTKPAEAPKSIKQKPQRQTKAMDELVGLSGEIHAFRFLQARYGPEVVTASSWVSSNSKHRFPLNQFDDGYGYDISFAFKNRLYRVEVKSTAGDDDTFSLGSSEIRTAMSLAKRSKRSKETFLLLHVKGALSSDPTFVVLPNPYDDRFRRQFIVEEADARIRYKTYV